MRTLPMLLAVGVLLLAPAATGQTARAPAPKPLAESLHGAAREAYLSGRLLDSHGDFAGAETKYGEAYELSHDPRLLYNQGVCEKERHRYARMQELLDRFVRESGAAITAADKRDVEAALAALKNLVGTVSVSVDVAGATVTLDGEELGTTPLAAAASVDLGKHTLVFKKDGFEPAERTIDVVGGSAMDVRVTLVRQEHTAQLVVTSEPQATVIVDGQAVGKERFDGKVLSGSHEVQVMAPGKVTYKAEVDLREHETRTLEVTLVSAHKPALWPWIVGGAVVAVGASVAGYFLLKPQDQLGPAPTGAAGGVHLATWGR